MLQVLNPTLQCMIKFSSDNGGNTTGTVGGLSSDNSYKTMCVLLGKIYFGQFFIKLINHNL